MRSFSLVCFTILWLFTGICIFKILYKLSGYIFTQVFVLCILLKASVAMRQDSATWVTQCLFTISTICYRLAWLCYKPSLNLLCCSPSRFQSVVTLIALPWQISHSCQGDMAWLLMTITDKMKIKQKGSVRGEMRQEEWEEDGDLLALGIKKGGLMKRGRQEKRKDWEM